MRYFKVDVPGDVEISVNGNEVIVKGPKGELKRQFKAKNLKMEVKDGVFEVSSDDVAMINTIKRHVSNMIKGVKEGFTRKMIVRYAHFPIKIKVVGKEVLIENFLGERKPRKARIHGNANVKVKGQELIVEGINLEDVTQTVANIRQATRIKQKDIRVFQDGIYPALE